jgi:hypothetical protein
MMKGAESNYDPTQAVFRLLTQETALTGSFPALL